MAKQTGEKPTNRRLLMGALLISVAVATIALAALLVSIFERRQEAQNRFVRMVEVTEVSTDPVPWGINWPYQFNTYRQTVDSEYTQYGGSSAMPQSKLEAQPWLGRLYAGYAFSLDYRELRGHAYMLYDQEVTERVTKRKQSGACLHCHASIIPTYRRLGLLSKGLRADTATLASGFNWPAVFEGFRLASTMDYAAAHAELLKTPDGTPGESKPLFPGGSSTHQKATDSEAEAPVTAGNGSGETAAGGEAHPVSCLDCHDPGTMKLRVTRPGFLLGISALAKSEQALAHLPSIKRWRESKQKRPYDPNKLASHQEMRTFVCAQCHVEYYCASKETLFFPWDNGLKVEDIEQTYDAHTFPDGTPFFDFAHGETGAPVYKAQHPEFELYSQGIHARSGVSCADCHMPYERQGAMKVSSHWVKSPMLSLNRSCQTCHNATEDELRARVEIIQGRTTDQIERAAQAMTDMLDAILEAQAAGASSEQLAPVYELQKKSMWRLDFISSENSKGFHADQEAARILSESIDYSRQAQAAAIRLRAPAPPQVERKSEPVYGVTPSNEAPMDPPPNR